MPTSLAEDSLELVWWTWLQMLNRIDAASYHTVLNHELEWHDRFCSGEWSWPDLKEEIRTQQFGNLPEKVG